MAGKKEKTREERIAELDAIGHADVSIGETRVTVPLGKAREFKTGSVGWQAQTRAELPNGERVIINVIATVIGSKEW